MAVAHSHDWRSRKIRPRGIESVAVFVQQAQRQRLIGHAAPRVEQFVAAAPEHNTWMRAQAMDDGARFRIEHLEVIRIVGIRIAGEREFLPYHQAHFVAQFEKRFFLNRRAAPHAQQIHVRLARGFEQRAQGFARDDAGENIRVDEIAALGKNRAPVDFQCYRRIGVRFRKNWCAF